MTTRQKRRQMQRRKKQLRRIRRRLRAYAARALVLTVLLLVGFLIIKGAIWILKSPEKLEDVFQGARIIEGGEEEPEGSPLIVLDAGHGGRDQGTSAGSALEKEINLAMVKKLAEELRAAGAAVLLTREDDTKVGLEERAAYANDKEAEIFVSLHCNFCEDDTGVKGVECYYRESSPEGQALAESIVRRMEEEEEISCRGTRIGDFRVLNKTDMPAVLVEMGYLSTRNECADLTDEAYQKLMAKRLAEGILANAHPSEPVSEKK